MLFIILCKVIKARDPSQRNSKQTKLWWQHLHLTFEQCTIAMHFNDFYAWRVRTIAPFLYLHTFPSFSLKTFLVEMLCGYSRAFNNSPRRAILFWLPQKCPSLMSRADVKSFCRSLHPVKKSHFLSTNASIEAIPASVTGSFEGIPSLGMTKCWLYSSFFQRKLCYHISSADKFHYWVSVFVNENTHCFDF